MGTAASLIGVLLALFFYYTGRRTRELVLYVHPLKTTVVKSGQSSGLQVLYKGREISSDVTAVQFGIWNQGRESIRPEHVLRDITILTKPRAAMLEATIIKPGRDVTRVSLDESRLSEGILPISWRILEHNDGAVVQVIHVGPPDTQIAVDGSIEGQPTIPCVAPKLTVPAAQAQVFGSGSSALFSLMTSVMCSIMLLSRRVFLPLMLGHLYAGKGKDGARRARSMERIFKYELLTFAIAAAAAAAYFGVRFFVEPSPPFSF